MVCIVIIVLDVVVAVDFVCWCGPYTIVVSMIVVCCDCTDLMLPVIIVFVVHSCKCSP